MLIDRLVKMNVWVEKSSGRTHRPEPIDSSSQKRDSPNPRLNHSNLDDRMHSHGLPDRLGSKHIVPLGQLI